MLRLNCPFCGPRDHHEFAYLEDASVQDDASQAQSQAYGVTDLPVQLASDALA